VAGVLALVIVMEQRTGATGASSLSAPSASSNAGSWGASMSAIENWTRMLEPVKIRIETENASAGWIHTFHFQRSARVRPRRCPQRLQSGSQTTCHFKKKKRQDNLAFQTPLDWKSRRKPGMSALDLAASSSNLISSCNF
jgi:hypothetical protein